MAKHVEIISLGKEYIKEAKKNGTYPGDIEISTAAILFGCKIRVYQQE